MSGSKESSDEVVTSINFKQCSVFLKSIAEGLSLYCEVMAEDV